MTDKGWLVAHSSPGETAFERLKSLSDDARVIAGVWFGLMPPGRGDLTLHLREQKPTARTQAALDELVEKGVVSVEPFNKFGGKVYRPLVSCFEAFREAGKLLERRADLNWTLMEPVTALAASAGQTLARYEGEAGVNPNPNRGGEDA